MFKIEKEKKKMSIPPQYVIDYHKNMQAMEQLKNEIALLKLQVQVWVNELPNRSFQLANVNLRVTDAITNMPPTQEQISSSLVRFLEQERPELTTKEHLTFAEKASRFIWDNRIKSSKQSLIYTQSSSKKRRLIDS